MGSGFSFSPPTPARQAHAPPRCLWRENISDRRSSILLFIILWYHKSLEALVIVIDFHFAWGFNQLDHHSSAVTDRTAAAGRALNPKTAAEPSSRLTEQSVPRRRAAGAPRLAPHFAVTPVIPVGTVIFVLQMLHKSAVDHRVTVKSRCSAPNLTLVQNDKS